jgi:hypothetical protein
MRQSKPSDEGIGDTIVSAIPRESPKKKKPGRLRKPLAPGW